MTSFVAVDEIRTAQEPAILLKAREKSAQRLMMAYAVTGLFFMLLPGTFLGVWNLISISGGRASSISTAWIQAHGHAQIFGWIGTFILGIGFYSIPKMTLTSGRVQRSSLGWAAWGLWTSGVLLRWACGFYHLYWRALLPLSALLELAGFLIFLNSVRRHRPAASRTNNQHMPVWILSVLVGTAGFGMALLLNLLVAIYVSLYDTGPAFPLIFEARFLALVSYAFIVPVVWGFSARWLPVFLGLKPLNERALRSALLLSIMGVVFAVTGFPQVAHWLLAIAAVVAVTGFRLFERPSQPAKTAGVHVSFPAFVRMAYVWLVIAAALGVCAVYFDHAHGWIGASRHALTVGFVSTMVFAIGQRVLPAFAGMRVLYSPRLMLLCLLLLNAGCLLRVSTEILAYENYWPAAWNALPWSAICELTAVTVFAANMLLTFKQPLAHLRSAEAAY
ncbi:MAG TPA: NnrS family protein [Alphaproteobacteria bacterium]|nr:NnrS family protein [Alphaproteobacteria bacterium]